MTARATRIPRLALLTLLATAVPPVAPPARASFTCSGGPGTGTVLANDNGFRAPFGSDPCSQKPVSHLYELCAGMPPTALWLGPSFCTCPAIADRCTDCGNGPLTASIGWCGNQASCGSGAENGVEVSYPVPSLSPRPVTFTICYSTVGDVQPVLLLRLGGPRVVEEWFNGLVAGQGVCVQRTLELEDDTWDVQVTLSDEADCIPTGAQEIYVGGETENYWLCVGDNCYPQLVPLNSNY